MALKPDPVNHNEDDQAEADEPNAPDAKSPKDDANMGTDDDDNPSPRMMMTRLWPVSQTRMMRPVQAAAKKEDETSMVSDDKTAMTTT